MTISVVLDDLAFFAAEALAWPVTADLSATTPLMRRVELAAGERLAAQLQVQEPLAVGSAVVTGAGDLGAPFLVHAVVSSRTERVTSKSVRMATTSALHRARDWQIEHLAIAPFGLGAGNLDPESSAMVMMEVIERHVAQWPFPQRITVIVENDDELSAFTSRLPREAP